MINYRLFSFLLFIPLLLSVTRSTYKGVLTPEEYTSWFNSHKSDFVKSIQINEFNYDLMLIPVELQLVNYSKKDDMTQKDVETFLNEHEGSLDFSLKIQIPENGTREFLKYESTNGKSYEDRLKYYSFEFQKNILLKASNGEEFHCTDYVFERSFDIQPAGTIRFSFSTSEDLKDIEIIINDKGFDDLNLKFSYDHKKINKRPKLKYSKIWKAQ